MLLAIAGCRSLPALRPSKATTRLCAGGGILASTARYCRRHITGSSSNSEIGTPTKTERQPIRTGICLCDAAASKKVFLLNSGKYSTLIHGELDFEKAALYLGDEGDVENGSDPVDLGYEMSVTEPGLVHYFVNDNRPWKLGWARAYSLADEVEQDEEETLAVISLHEHALVVHAQRHTPDAALEVEKRLLENVLEEDPGNVMLVLPPADADEEEECYDEGQYGAEGDGRLVIERPNYYRQEFELDVHSSGRAELIRAFIDEWGVEEQEVVDCTQAYPPVLDCDLETTVRPMMDFLIAEKLVQIVVRGPSPPRAMLASLEEELCARMLLHNPYLLTNHNARPALLKQSLDYLREQGLDVSLQVTCEFDAQGRLRSLLCPDLKDFSFFELLCVPVKDYLKSAVERLRRVNLQSSSSSLYTLFLEESRSVELGSAHDVLPKKYKGRDRNYYYFPSACLSSLGEFVKSKGRRTRELYQGRNGRHFLENIRQAQENDCM